MLGITMNFDILVMLNQSFIITWKFIKKKRIQSMGTTL